MCHKTLYFGDIIDIWLDCACNITSYNSHPLLCWCNFLGFKYFISFRFFLTETDRVLYPIEASITHLPLCNGVGKLVHVCVLA